MDTPVFNDGQFVNSVLLNQAFGSVASDFLFHGSEAHTPGLINPSSIQFSSTGLNLTVALPSPFAVLFASGSLVGAHGMTNDQDSQSTTLNLSSLVPGSGSQTVYIVAAYATIGQNNQPVPGPPPGHPDYDPSFVSFEADQTTRETLNVSATLTAPNNTTVFELGRVTLASGASQVGTVTTSFWQYASSILNPTGVTNGWVAPSALNIGSDGRVIAAQPRYAADSGATNALAISLSPSDGSANLPGTSLFVKVANTNTGASTLSINGGTANSIVNQNGATLLPAQIIAGYIVELSWNPSASVWQLISAPPAVRTRLYSPLTLFVSPSGNDNNSGLSSGSPFETMQAAVNAVYNNYDLGGYQVTIDLANGTYTQGVTVNQSPLGAPATVVPIIFNGNTVTQNAVTISVTSANCFNVQNGASVQLQGMTLVATGSNQIGALTGNGVNASQGSSVTLGLSVTFGACGAYQMLSQGGAEIGALNNYYISAGAAGHAVASESGSITIANNTISVQATATFSQAFIIATANGTVQPQNLTFAGSGVIEGQQYLATLNGVINTNTGNPGYLPGSIAGTTSTGGQYH